MSESNNEGSSNEPNDGGAVSGEASAAPDTGAAGAESGKQPESGFGPSALATAKESGNDAPPEGEKPAAAPGAEAKPEDKEVKPEDKKSEEKKEEPEGAPEQYADFQAPEGIALDTGMVNAFKGVAKELNLSQKSAQAIIDKVAPEMARSQFERAKAINQDWVRRAQADPELGGEHAAAAQSAIARFRDQFSRREDGSVDPDIKEFMELPFGNHPGLLKLLAHAGQKLCEGDFPQGQPAKSKKPTAEDFYASARRI